MMRLAAVSLVLMGGLSCKATNSAESRESAIRLSQKCDLPPANIPKVLKELAPGDEPVSGEAPGATLEDIAQVRERLVSGDRGGVYMMLYNLTGQEFWLMDAQITTFSGLFGGAALRANYLIKKDHPDKYVVSMDTFSHEILQNMVSLVEESVKNGDRGYVKPDQLLARGDGPVWRKYGLGDAFPGHALYFDVFTYGLENFSEVFSKGTLYTYEASPLKAPNYGKMPSEFKRHPGFLTYNGGDGRFTIVYSKERCRTEVFYDRDASTYGFKQVKDYGPFTPFMPEYHERLSMWEFTQSNQDTNMKFNPRLWRDQAPIRNPNLIEYQNDVYFYVAPESKWYDRKSRQEVRDADLLTVLKKKRAETIADRVRGGFSEEPEVPARYKR